jgi:Cu/Ag efflux protein CusF
MNKLIGLFAGALVTLSLAGPIFGQSSTPSTNPSPSTAPAMKDTPAASEKPSATEQKPSKLSLTHHVTGEVVAVDQNAKTVTVKKGAKGKEMTFNAEGGAVSRLSDIKEGDRVKVTYKKSHNQLLASEIVRSPAATSKAK